MHIKDLVIGKKYRVKAQPPHTKEEIIIFTRLDEKTNAADGYVVGKKPFSMVGEDGIKRTNLLYTYGQVKSLLHMKKLTELP